MDYIEIDRFNAQFYVLLYARKINIDNIVLTAWHVTTHQITNPFNKNPRTEKVVNIEPMRILYHFGTFDIVVS